ncbi:hypothetical protein SPSF3K_00490 [Streptococcus parauberis]|nr:hypothetical protein SPSF3K_00490 [Streptococcus parauberis]
MKDLDNYEKYFYFFIPILDYQIIISISYLLF